jgi:hypothetical protein
MIGIRDVNMKKILIIFITIFSLFIINSVNINVHAVTLSDYVQIADENDTAWINDYNNEVNNQSTGDCNSLLGSPSDSTSVAWLLFTVLNWMRVLGPLAVIVLSGIEFAQAIVKSDDDTMKKAKGHLTTRLVMAGLLFLIPSVVKLLLDVFNLTSDPMCGIGG